LKYVSITLTEESLLKAVSPITVFRVDRGLYLR